MNKEIVILFQVIGAVSFVVCWLSIGFLMKRSTRKVLPSSLFIHFSYLLGLGICATKVSGYNIIAVVFGLYFCLFAHAIINLVVGFIKSKKPSRN